MSKKEGEYEKNYAFPVLRNELNNKLDSGVKQLAARIIKNTLMAKNVFVFEDNVQNKEKHLTSGLQDTFKKQTLWKNKKVYESSKEKLISLGLPDLVDCVPEENTSKICPNCGVVHGKDSYDEKKIENHLQENNRINLAEFTKKSREKIDPEILAETDTLYRKFLAESQDLYKVDLGNLTYLFTKDFYKKHIKDDEMGIDSIKDVSYADYLDYLDNIYDKKQDKKINKFISDLFSKNPRWFNEFYQVSRCL